MEQLLLRQAVAAYQSNDPAKAETLLRTVLQIAPKNCDALHFLGLLHADRKQHEQAIRLIRQAITIAPQMAAFHANLASSQRELHQYDDALKSLEEALRLNPQLAEALNTRGNILRILGHLDEALKSLDAAISLQPHFHEAYDNRGNVLRDMGELDTAIQSYQEARRLAPGYASAAWNESLCWLLKGNFAKGWPLYEAGWQLGLRAPWRNFREPRWTGVESLSGKTILLHAEQGLGDTIQFCRYASILKEKGAHVILEVQPPLVALLKAMMADGIPVIRRGDALPGFDFHCPLLSLPGACQTTLQNIPAPPSWHNTPGIASARPRIGVVCSGNPSLENDRNRSIPLQTLAPLFDLPAEFHCLQPDLRPEDRRLAGTLPHLIDHTVEIRDFTDTAELIGQMNLVISVDTAVAHLAASLGRPTWILLSHIPDWRWLMERPDSPWYPSARLFRQKQAGQWSDLLQRELIPALRTRLQTV